MHIDGMTHGQAAFGGLYPFFPRTTLSTWMSQGLLGHEPLQPLVLLFKPPQATRLGHVHSAVLAKRRVGHPMLSAQRRYRHPGFGLLENPKDLLLGNLLFLMTMDFFACVTN